MLLLAISYFPNVIVLIGLLIVPSTVTPLPPPNHYTELSFSWRTQVLGRHGFITAPPYENPLVSIQKKLGSRQ